MALTVLDASIVIAVLDSGDPHHAAARASVATHLGARDRLVVPASAYADVLVGPFRRGPEAVAIVDAFLAALPCSVEPVSREIAVEAARLRADHGASLRLPDALVVATAHVLEAGALVTADARWPGDLGTPIEVIGQA